MCLFSWMLLLLQVTCMAHDCVKITGCRGWGLMNWSYHPKSTYSTLYSHLNYTTSFGWNWSQTSRTRNMGIIVLLKIYNKLIKCVNYSCPELATFENLWWKSLIILHFWIWKILYRIPDIHNYDWSLDNDYSKNQPRWEIHTISNEADLHVPYRSWQLRC